METVKLYTFNNSGYRPRNLIIRSAWYLVNIILLKSNIPYPYCLKRMILRFFGARVGKGVVIKPNVNIKYPWFLAIGSHSWIGEGVCIDNLGQVSIGNNVCISQWACILTGNHNYSKTTFDLMINPVVIEDGAWVGAKSIVCPGVTIKTHSVLTVGSVATQDTEQYGVYQGNPAQLIRQRKIE